MNNTLYGIVDGYTGFALAKHMADASGPVLYIARDESHASDIESVFAFAAPDIPVYLLPAWDCLPYDRVSPKHDIIAARVACLTALANHHDAQPCLVIASVQAAIQRVPQPSCFKNLAIHIEAGGTIALPALQTHLTQQGYTRTAIVREPGEFAVRGGIVDLFCPGHDAPIRLDLFGDHVERMNYFDPISQKSAAALPSLTLQPATELHLSESAIERFRIGYRAAFGSVVNDPLYEAISAGHPYPGYEHWLPLFYDQLETLFGYKSWQTIFLDHQAHQAAIAARRQIEDFHDARSSFLKTATKQNFITAYKPLVPDALYVALSEWDTCLHKQAIIHYSPFSSPTDHHDNPLQSFGHFLETRTNNPTQLFSVVVDTITRLVAEEWQVIIAASTQGSAERLKTMLVEHGLASLTFADRLVRASNPAIAILPLENGFIVDALAIITENDIFGDRLIAKAKKKRSSSQFLSELASLQAGDLIVHTEHGLGRFDGLETLTVMNAPHDCLRLIYDGGDKLYVPVENIDVLSRYGNDNTNAALDKLGGTAWQARRARVKKRLKDMAEELLKIAALRELKQGEIITPPDGAYGEFCARFPYAETDDQLSAIDAVLHDFLSGRPMDRLVCGDVGFGKTEIALRAAFLAAMAGLQIAVLTPTTLLCRQHFHNFKKRFQGLPIRIAQLSRLVTAKDSKAIKTDVEAGQVDIVIGTHALLGSAVKFKKLGLIIVDEEQHFGVKQKEKLKALADNVHILTLTATPIPRTLQLALSGVRDMSLITTPPIDRLAVRTFVMPFDPVVVREAIMREHYRGGQSFYVCPRIDDLPMLEERLRTIIPEVKFITAHGQMPPAQLEERMQAFCDGEYDVLLATNIIESGLDIPRANTLIIHRADLFGLAQLYQIRGRIGRGKLRGYAYLTWPETQILAKSSEQRLKIIEQLDTLGSGFQLASHDMDLRGGGNLLGEEQSGHIREVGIELFQQMLEDAVNAARQNSILNSAVSADHRWSPQINLGLAVLIPEQYVPDLNIRMSLYRRLGDLDDSDSLDGFSAELIDRFGTYPIEVDNLLKTVRVKQLCRIAGIAQMDAGPKGVMVAFHNTQFANVPALMSYLQKHSGSVKLRPDQKLVFMREWDSNAKRLAGAEKIANELAALI